MAKIFNRTVTVNIDGSQLNNTVPGIQKKIRELTRDVKKMTIGTEEYNKTVKKISDLNSILADHKRAIRGVAEETKSLGEKIGAVADFFNKWYYSVQTALDAFGGLTTSARNSVNAYAEMEEAMADVRKYTGQTSEQVHEMNEDFKKIDTRTARAELNALAGSAGRLGITNKEVIEEFVDGANMLNVALRDDLGDKGVDQVGKLAQMFGEDDKKGLRGAMLATGSAVNELAQSSSANAGYIVNFTADLSGVAIQAGMTQTQIMGLASALDQNMQEEATASTVFSQLITKMYQEPARFAALAGQDVKSFTNLLKTDANEALLKFLSAMQATGGFDKMAPLFSEMKLEGTRAVGVLSAVASHLDQVREAQLIANDAYNDGTSIIKEYNVQNNTVQANIDKAKKQFLDLSIELGEKLLPLVQHSITAGSLLVRTIRLLYGVGEFLVKHAAAIAAVSAALLFYNGVLSITLIKTKLYNVYLGIAIALDTSWRASVKLTRAALVAVHAVWALVTKGVQGYIVVMRAAKLASLTNPWAALATVLSVVGVAIYSAVKAWQEHKKAVHDNLQEVKEANAIKQQQAEIDKKVADSHVEEKTRVEQLSRIIRSNAYSVNERRAAIAALQEIIPSYHASIKNEGKLYEENKEAVDDYIKQLDRLAMAQAISEQKVNIARQRLALKQKEQRIRYSIKAVNAEIESNPEYYKEYYNYKEGGRTMRGVSHALAEKERERGVHEHRLKDNQSQQKVLQARERALDNMVESDKELKSAVVSQIVRNNSKDNASGVVKPGHYVSPEKAAAARRKEEVEAKKKVEKELDAISTEYENKRTKAKEAYLKGDIATQEDYNRIVEDLQLEELNKKLEVAGLEPKKRAEIEKKILDYKVKLYDQLKEIEQSFGDTEAEQLKHELDKIEQKYKQDLALLDNLHEKKIISEQEYQEKIKLLKARYNKDVESANINAANKMISDAKDSFEVIMKEQRKANIKAGVLDEQSQSEKREAWKGYLEKMLDDTKLSGEQRMAIQEEIDNAEVEQTEESLQAKQEMTQKYNDILCETIVSAGQVLGEQLGKVLQGEKADFKDFLRSILSLAIEALEKTVLAARAASIAKNVSTLGAAGMAKAAVETALITAAFEMAKSAVSNFYTGGFTPNGPWNKPQGVVHSNEFVANRFATGNPHVLPVLNLIDEAQRTGSVSRLTSDDIAAVIPSPQTFHHGSAAQQSPALSSPYVASQQEAVLLNVFSRVVKSLDAINDRFSQPIIAETYATGRHGTIEAEELVNKMKSNVSRRRK
ncbi:MAG: phage tail tape measure protein [Bacteroidaceae bacterium]|nr:phage tail tape measure protein [Bacteroidaceae bacterium]